MVVLTALTFPGATERSVIFRDEIRTQLFCLTFRTRDEILLTADFETLDAIYVQGRINNAGDTSALAVDHAPLE